MDIEVTYNIEVRKGAEGGSKDESSGRLKNYARRRASQQYNALSAMSLGDNPFRNLHGLEAPGLFSALPVPKPEIHDALSTAEFLLALPMAGEHRRVRSVGSSASASSRSPKPDRKLSCSDRLKLSMQKLVEDSKGDLMVQPNNVLRKDSLLDSDDDDDYNMAARSFSLPPKRQTFPQGCRKSTSSLLDGDDSGQDDEDEDKASETMDICAKPRFRRVKSEAHQYSNSLLSINSPTAEQSIRFSLRRQSCSFKVEPETTARRRSSSTTDWLHKNLKNLMIDSSCPSLDNSDGSHVVKQTTLKRAQSFDQSAVRGRSTVIENRGDKQQATRKKSLTGTPNNFKLPTRKRSISPMPIGSQSPGGNSPSRSPSFKEIPKGRASLSPVPRRNSRKDPLGSSSNHNSGSCKTSLSPVPRPNSRKGSLKEVLKDSSLLGIPSLDQPPSATKSLVSNSNLDSSSSHHSSRGSFNSASLNSSWRLAPSRTLPPSGECSKRGLQVLLKTAELRSSAGLDSLDGSVRESKQPRCRNSLQLSRLNASTSNLLNSYNSSLLSDSKNKSSRRPLHSSSFKIDRSDLKREMVKSNSSTALLDSKNKKPAKESSCSMLTALTSLNRSLSSKHVPKSPKKALPANSPHPKSASSCTLSPSILTKLSKEKHVLTGEDATSSKKKLTPNDRLKSTLCQGLASQAADRLAQGALTKREFDFSFAPLGDSKRPVTEAPAAASSQSDAQAMPPPPPPPSKLKRMRSKSPLPRSRSAPMTRTDSKKDLNLTDHSPATKQPRLGSSQGSRRNVLGSDPKGSRRNLMVSSDPSTTNDPSHFFITGSRIRRYNSFTT